MDKDRVRDEQPQAISATAVFLCEERRLWGLRFFMYFSHNILVSEGGQ